MEEKINKNIEGRECPRCEGTHLNQMSDNRFKFRDCFYKYSYKKLRDDYIALFFS